MHRRYLELMLVGGLSLVPLVLELLGVDGIAWRLVPALLLTFVLPGYALLAALSPARQLDKTEHLLLILGLSLAMSILGGLALNFTPWGLSNLTWAAWLGGVTLGSCLVALARHEAISTPAGPLLPQVRLANAVPGALIVVGAIVAVTGAVTLATTAAARYPSADVVQLWALPETKSDGTSLQIGVSTLQAQAATYRLRVQQGHQLVKEWPAISLSGDDRWESQMALPANPAHEFPVDVLLYRQDDSNVFRQVRIWIGPK